MKKVRVLTLATAVLMFTLLALGTGVIHAQSLNTDSTTEASLTFSGLIDSAWTSITEWLISDAPSGESTLNDGKGHGTLSVPICDN